MTQALEPFAALDSQTACDPTEKPGVRAVLDYVLARFGGVDGGIVRACAIGGRSEHKEGRAFDWMILPSDPAATDMLDWLLGPDSDGTELGNVRRLGVMYVVFNRQIWRAYGARKWEPYSGTNPHTDHVHVSFSKKGAMARTSGYDVQISSLVICAVLAAVSLGSLAVAGVPSLL